MRRYPVNTPLAAARVVALTLLADGTISRGELNALVRLGFYDRLGVSPSDMQAVLEDLARDLFEFGAPVWSHGADGLHPLLVRCVLDDVTDAQLRQQVLGICATVAEADSHLTDGENAILHLARTKWEDCTPMTA